MSNSLRHSLLHATVEEQAAVIDWVQRPWAPASNDALRGAWHEARRHHGARRALAYALEQEVRGLASAARDLEHVAARLGLTNPTVDGVAAEIARRVGGAPAVVPPGISPDVIASVLQVGAEVVLRLLRDGRRGHARRRHGSR